ncbi:hypothetical protein EXN32_20890 [Agrobacterium tumefaciens]|uniref:hypothetical protein n=1 Tax=Agrobacterium TaxID=357 RepID=UPI00115F36F3|nr:MULTISPECIES: hypothetical protein [Agrobacterium]MDA5241273.1 hypothetical protein [Agrobacterium sp. MAFF310724]MDA5249441.1 hypothetical protein [Agrobacterium sp. MAFF210268]TRB13111.1 hypothetical protein EXN32_20890 [Agrobacterium tumefaciens]UNZ54215.1 hypothetical protein MLE07_26320 [Agrobacterium tumefaciens]
MSNDDCDKWLNKKADKGMNAERLFTLVGMTNTDHDVIDAIKANGGSIDALSPKKLKDLTIDFVRLNNLGVALAFTPKELFSRNYRDPIGSGPMAMSGVFYYPNGAAMVSPYLGSIPFSSRPVGNRDEALAAFGKPQETEEEDGDVYWDIWMKDGRQVKADYNDELAVKTVLVSFPMKGS